MAYVYILKSLNEKSKVSLVVISDVPLCMKIINIENKIQNGLWLSKLFHTQSTKSTLWFKTYTHITVLKLLGWSYYELFPNKSWTWNNTFYETHFILNVLCNLLVLYCTHTSYITIENNIVCDKCLSSKISHV